MAKNKSAVTDGLLVRQYTSTITYRGKGGARIKRKRYRLTADEVVLLVKRHIRRTMGDWMENNAEVYGVSGGYFWIKLPYRRPINNVADDQWRAMLRQGVSLRRYSIGLALRAMHGEVLT